MLSAVAARKARLEQTDRWSSKISSHSSDEGADGIVYPSNSLHGTIPGRGAGEHPPLSTWRPNNENLQALDADDLAAWSIPTSQPARLVLLRKSERLALLGVYSITVVHGAVLLAGTPLGAGTGPHRVFAPWSSPLPLIECCDHDQPPASHPLGLRYAVENHDAAVVLQECQTGIEGLGRVCRTFANVFEAPRGSSRNANSVGLSGLQLVESQSGDIQPLVQPPSWKKAVFSALKGELTVAATARPVFLIQGAKRSGKSSFSRLLVNTLLIRFRLVAFLECDLGQSEFTPSGMVSLNIVSRPVFGPPFTHPSIPFRAHFIGSTSPKDSPGPYLDAIRALIQTYDIEVQHYDMQDSDQIDERSTRAVPLVVNTMGWIKGMGAYLSQRIAEIVRPNDIFDMTGSTGETGDEYPVVDSSSAFSHAFAGCVTNVHKLESPPAMAFRPRFSPADHRTLSILSYFHAVFSGSLDSKPSSIYTTYWNTSQPLCAQRPYEVVVGRAIRSLVLVGPGSEDIHSSQISPVLNGAVVALVNWDSEPTSNQKSLLAAGFSYTRGAPLPSPLLSSCIGLALIRSFVTQEGSLELQIQLLTPVPSNILADFAPSVIVKGSLELPIWGFLDFKYINEVPMGFDAPYLKWGKGGETGGEQRRVRRNLLRRGLQ